MNRSDALDAWRRGLQGPSEVEAPEGPGMLSLALEYAGRPVSGVMGGFFGALSPEVDVAEGMRQGFTGERHFSAHDFLVEGGFDPDAKSTRLLGLGADVLNPADPLNYVGAGFTKLGKVAKGLSVAGEGAASVGKISSRAEAAALGLWSPLNVAGQRVVPKALSVPVARAIDAVGNRVSKSKFVEALSPYLGGVKKFEAQYPGVSSMMKGLKRATDVDEESFVDELVGIEKGLRASGFDDGAVESAMRDVTSLLEAPESRLVRVERELELVDDALAGKFTEWLPEGLPAAEVEEVTTVNFANQRAVDRRVAELELARRAAPNGELGIVNSELPGVAPVSAMETQIIDRYLGASGGATETRVRLADLRKGLSATARAEQDAVLLQMQRDGKLVLNRLDDPQEITDADRAAALMLSGDNPRHLVYLKPSALGETTPPAPPQAGGSLLDELHVLKSVQAARFAEDMPPMDVLMARRESLAGEAEKIRTLWDEAGPATLQAYAGLRPLLKATRDLYEEPLKKLDPDFEFPVEDYVKHMFPAAYSKLPRNVVKAREAALAEKTALVEELAGQGLDEAGIALELRKRMGAKLALLEGNVVDKTGLLKGDLDAFKQRQFKMTVDEFNEWARERGLDTRFENYSASIASAMRRDASRWRYGFEIHKWVDEKPGWTIGAEGYAGLSRAEQKGWVPMDFHVPWIDPKKNPFAGKYMKKEVKALMESQLKGMGNLLTDDGLNGLLGALNTFRQYWVAWTLAPFPDTRVRDLVSDMVLGHQAGLNPAIDLAKGAAGRSAYLASAALNARRAKSPWVQGMAGASPANLNHFLSSVQAKFPELTEEKLVEYMEIEGILGASAVRDLDLAKILSNDPLMQKANRGVKGTLRDLVRLNPEKNPIIKTGFSVAEKSADFTRGALFFHTLMDALPEAKSLDDALTYATAKVRRHLFDYADLTQVERDVLKNIVPFYTFTAKNLPLQLTMAATEPGKMQWVNRLYQSAWGQFNEDGGIQDEDLPKWLREGLGMPIDEITMEDGVKGYAIWSPRGWLPQTELNEMADLLRGKLGSQLFARLTPLLKEPMEQIFEKDLFTGQAIDDGTVRDVMGIPVGRRAAHLVNNLRLVTAVDRLDPGGLWTKVGQHMGWWEDSRPHRWAPPEGERWTRAFTGLNVKGVAPTQQAERNFRDADREANSAMSRARYAVRRGQTLEAEGFMAQVQEHRSNAIEALGRLNELRMLGAVEVARKEASGFRP